MQYTEEEKKVIREKLRNQVANMSWGTYLSCWLSAAYNLSFGRFFDREKYQHHRAIQKTLDEIGYSIS